MHDVYLLRSQTSGDQRYVGLTTDLKKRLSDHNAGKSPHTSRYLPWNLVTYVACSDNTKAETFERYLKSGSGHPLQEGASGKIAAPLRLLLRVAQPRETKAKRARRSSKSEDGPVVIAAKAAASKPAGGVDGVHCRPRRFTPAAPA